MRIGKKVQQILVIASIGIFATALAGCGGSKDTGANKSGSGSKKVITVAHTNYYVPYDYVNDKGESDGYEVAVMKEVAKRLPQYEFKFVPTSDDDLLIGVESGKYDIGTKGIWKTAAREKKYIYPKNYLGASVIGLVIRKDMDSKIQNMDDFAKLGGKLVPIAPQDARYNVIAEYNKTHESSPIKLDSSEAFQIADAYTWVMEGRYDGYLEVELSYKTNVVDAKGPYHQFADKLDYRRYAGIPIYPLFNKKDQQIADDYDKVIVELKNDGTLDKLQQQYFGEDLTKYISK